MMRAPIIEPRMLPTPPFKLAPPITTAAMMSSSSPIATVGLGQASDRGCFAEAFYGLDNRKNKFPAGGVMEMLFVPLLALME